MPQQSYSASILWAPGISLDDGEADRQINIIEEGTMTHKVIVFNDFN